MWQLGVKLLESLWLVCYIAEVNIKNGYFDFIQSFQSQSLDGLSGNSQNFLRQIHAIFFVT